MSRDKEKKKQRKERKNGKMLRDTEPKEGVYNETGRERDTQKRDKMIQKMKELYIDGKRLRQRQIRQKGKERAGWKETRRDRKSLTQDRDIRGKDGNRAK